MLVPWKCRQSKVGSTRVRLLGTAALSGRYGSSKAKYGWETDSEQVLWRKDEKDFEKRVKRSEIVEKEAIKLTCVLKGQCGNTIEAPQSAGQNQVWSVKKGASRTGHYKLEGLRWFCQNGFYRPVLKHGPRSLSYMRVCRWKTYTRNESERCAVQTAASTDLVRKVCVRAYLIGPERWWTMPE